ncbi:MAG: hypothetical protein ACFFG0_44085, partial [Candidatus Thorarchaeota archaeon]
MSETQLLLDKVRNNSVSWEDFSACIALNSKDLIELFNITQEITRRNFNNTLKIYTPTTRFPAISITGSECALECEHCNRKYLKGMKKLISNEELEQFLIQLSKKRGVGAL